MPAGAWLCVVERRPEAPPLNGLKPRDPSPLARQCLVLCRRAPPGGSTFKWFKAFPLALPCPWGWSLPGEGGFAFAVRFVFALLYRFHRGLCRSPCFCFPREHGPKLRSRCRPRRQGKRRQAQAKPEAKETVNSEARGQGKGHHHGQGRGRSNGVRQTRAASPLKQSKAARPALSARHTRRE